MKIEKLTMQGFGRYATKQEIDFKGALETRNIFVVTGKTGAGKTTIFDAINFALYGEASGTSRDGKSLRSDHADPDTKTQVELIFSLRGEQYCVRRSPQYLRTTLRGKDKLVESKAAAELILPDGRVLAKYQEVTKEIEQILGISAQQFRQLVMIPQGEFKKLLEAPSDQKEQIFRKIFGTDGFQAVQKELSKQANELEGTIKQVQRDREHQISTFQCVPDHSEVEAQLQVLLEAKEPNIAAICQGMDACLTEEKQGYQIQLDVKQQLDEKLQALQQGYALARSNNQKLEQLTQVEQQVQQLQEQAETMEGKRQCFQQATKAAKVDPIALTYQQASQHKEELLQEVVRLQKQWEETKQATKELQNQYEALEQQKPEVEQWNRKLEQVQGLRLQVQAYQQVQQALSTYQVQQGQLEQQLVELEARLQQGEETAKDLAEQLVQLQQAKEQRAQYLLEQKDVAHGLEQIHQLELEWNEWGEVCQKHKELASQYQQLEEAYQESKQSYEGKEEAWRRNQAGILAATLEPNQPCPVCGSLTHPRKAVLDTDVISEELVNQAKEAYEQLEQKRQGIYQQVFTYQEQKASRKHQLLTITAPKVLGAKQVWELEQVAAQAQAQRLSHQQRNQELGSILTKLEVQLAQEGKVQQLQVTCQQTQEADRKQQQQLQQQLQELQVKRATAETKGQTLQEAFEGTVQTEGELAREQQQLTKNIQDFQVKWEQSQTQYTKGKSRLDQLSATLQTRQGDAKQAEQDQAKAYQDWGNMCQQQGFLDLTAYQQARLEEATYLQLQNQLLQYDKQVWELTTTRERLQEETKDLQVVDVVVLEANLQAEQEKRKEQDAMLRDLQSKLDHNGRVYHMVQTLTKSIAKEEEKYLVLGSVASEINGKNPRKLSLERYVLAAYFEEIIAAANLRFCDMTANQYELFRKDTVGDGRIQQGLDLEVLDNYTGKKRSVQTLSGGEGFKASLALALGLADVVQSHTGGIQLDTMFIDEGFGTLDPESLDSAIECLVDLQQDGRVIGIISHIAELKERIPTHLQVTTTREGSTVSFRS